MFEHDPKANRLSVQDSRRGLCLSLAHSRRAVADAAWFSAVTAPERNFEAGEKAHGHMPRCDNASQSRMRRPMEQEKVQVDVREDSECEHESPEQ